MDFYPTLAEIGGAQLPTDRIIDGKNILPLMLSGGNAKSPHDAFFYYMQDNLEAVRDRKWKLHVRKGDREIRELYDLEADPGETRNLYDAHPEVVARPCRRSWMPAGRDIGDAATGVRGAECEDASGASTIPTR